MTGRLIVPLEGSEMAKQSCLLAQSMIYDASLGGLNNSVCMCVTSLETS